MTFCQPFGYYRRFRTHPVRVGPVSIGGRNPIRIQSMVNTPTEDVSATVNQCVQLAAAGCELIRITVKNQRDVSYFGQILRQFRSQGYVVPLVADVHFNPAVAIAVAEIAEKVRINPGNFSDVSKSAGQKFYSEREFVDGRNRIHANILPLLEVCRKNGTALRLGVNHGSLSWRLVERYGNGPAGMVATAMEFLGIFEQENFRDVVVSMKASNPFVMIHATRMLVQKMHEKGMTYPIHLGVTEAGLGTEGIYRSAMGTGPLLCDGIGDTVRVSLSSSPVSEIQVCRDLIAQARLLARKSGKNETWPYDALGNTSGAFDRNGIPGILLPAIVPTNTRGIRLYSTDRKSVHRIRADVARMYRTATSPILLTSNERAGLRHAVISGTLLADQLCAGWAVSKRKGYHAVLSASGMLHGQTIYISCPTCGRTSYNLEKVAEEVKKKTKQFPQLKIAIMGCIVNGPGEMEGADYGILGESRGSVSIYKGKSCIRKGVDEKIAAEVLYEMIARERGGAEN